MGDRGTRMNPGGENIMPGPDEHTLEKDMVALASGDAKIYSSQWPSFSRLASK